ncbi:hypothetical protein Q1695_011933 [Nippostrongylus brasiliensis]|nr:hypothetical protein Q1695_011933 [Nippostrongylus brasiliensis]
MCQRSAKFLAEPSFFSTTVHDPAEIRRAFSVKSSSSPGSPPTEKSLRRGRPSSVHAQSSNDIALTRRDTLDNSDQTRFSWSASQRPQSRKELTIALVGRSWKSEDVHREMMPNASTLSLRTNAMDQQLSVDANSSHDLSPKKTSQLSLSAKHKKVLRSTFLQMNSGGTFLKLMEQVFRRLEAKYPDIRSIFLTTAFVNSLSRERASPPLVRTEHDHCKCLVGLFEKIMDNLSEPDSWLGSIRIYGEKHAQMKESGMSANMIEHFGEIAVAVIAAQVATPRITRERRSDIPCLLPNMRAVSGCAHDGHNSPSSYEDVNHVGLHNSTILRHTMRLRISGERSLPDLRILLAYILGERSSPTFTSFLHFINAVFPFHSIVAIGKEEL